MKVIVKKPYLNYSIDEEIDVRPQDAALLIPRGVVVESGKTVEVKEVIPPPPEPPEDRIIKQGGKVNKPKK